jgi:hypothetical protein
MKKISAVLVPFAAVVIGGGWLITQSANAEGYKPRFHIIEAILHSDNCPKRNYDASKEFKDICEDQTKCILNEPPQIGFWFKYSAGRDFCDHAPKFIQIRYYCGEPPDDKRFQPVKIAIENPVKLECPAAP